MSEEEFYVWQKYRAKRGTLNLGMRLEFLLARGMFDLKQGTKLEEVVRYHEAEKPDETPVDPSALAAMFGANRRVNRGN